MFVQRSQRKEPLNLQHKRTSSFLSLSYSKNKTKQKQKNKFPLALPKPSPKEKSTGLELSCTDNLHWSVSPIHWARRPCRAQPKPRATGRNISGHRYAPNSSEAFPAELRDTFTSFLLLIVKIKLKQSKGKLPSCIWLKALTFPFDLFSFPIHMLNVYYFFPPKA